MPLISKTERLRETEGGIYEGYKVASLLFKLARAGQEEHKKPVGSGVRSM